ncbi:MAG: ABC transporter substrate-binding protein [Anaerolineae bacterium]|nr:ABC transporter substrate-binding protein [Anaerolineae bacterium]
MKRHLILFIGMLALQGIMGGVAAQNETPTGVLEIFSWWAGDEGPALEALIELYNSHYPKVEVINATVTGGAGVNFRAVLKTRMLGGNPPDSFQVHAGQELIGTWVIANRMQDLTWLYEEEDWFDVFPQDLIDQLSYEGGIYAVPVNIHRAGVLWYIPDNLGTWGISVPTTLDEFYAICATLQSQGITPLVLGEAWTAIHLWDQVALSVLDADGYEALWTGGLSPTSSEMIAVWDSFGRVLDCTNIHENAAGLSWQQATDRLVAGDAAFNVMGDWVAGYLSTTLEMTAGEDYSWANFPGTEGAFTWLSDTFGLPVDAPNEAAAVAWLRLLGSVEGQNTFNPLKGSIPARIDAVSAAPELYNTYLQYTAEEWANERLVGSMMHGVVANERFMGDFNQVLDIYIQSRSSTGAAAAMEAVCVQAGACGF